MGYDSLDHGNDLQTKSKTIYFIIIQFLEPWVIRFCHRLPRSTKPYDAESEAGKTNTCDLFPEGEGEAGETHTGGLFPEGEGEGENIKTLKSVHQLIAGEGGNTYTNIKRNPTRFW